MKQLIEKLKLTKSLCVFDLETTGLNPKDDRIIEVYVKKINVDGSVNSFKSLVNPSPVKNSKEAFDKHGISDETLLKEKSFSQIAKELHEFIKDSDWCGYNILRFDLQFLMHEFFRNNIVLNYKKNKIIDVKNIYTKIVKPGTLEFAHKYLVGEELKNNHRAEVDVNATISVLDELTTYVTIDSDKQDRTVNGLHNLSISNNAFDMSERIILVNNEYQLNFGKHKGKNVFEIFEKENSYYTWLMNSDETPIDTKLALKGLYLYHQKNK